MFVQNYNSNLSAAFYASNNRSNKNDAFDLEKITEAMNNSGDKSQKSGGVLFESFGLISLDGSGNYRETYPLKISYDENYSTDNPILHIETKDKDGNTISSKVNINDINPNEATGTEMLALISHAHKDNVDGGFKSQVFFRYKSVGQAALSNDGNIDNTAKYMEEINNWNILLKNNMDLYFKMGDISSYAQSKDLLSLILANGI